MSIPTPSEATGDPPAPAPVGSNGPATPPPEVQQLVASPKQRHPALVLVSIVLVVIIAAAAISFIVMGGDHQSTNDAYVQGRIVRISPRVSGPVFLAAFAIALGEWAAMRHDEHLTYRLEGRS
jgi:hypothetical protein